MEDIWKINLRLLAELEMAWQCNPEINLVFCLISPKYTFKSFGEKPKVKNVF
jgi:hypothetical protein